MTRDFVFLRPLGLRLGKWFPPRLDASPGGTALLKKVQGRVAGRNLAQVGVPGDGAPAPESSIRWRPASERACPWNRFSGRGSGRRRCRRKGQERSRKLAGPQGWRTDGAARGSTWRRRNRRGERRRGRLTPDRDVRIDPRKKASKSDRVRVAAGQPVSAYGIKARRHGLATSRARLRVGIKPLNGNPGRGCGMKEAREAEGGASRREVAKT